MNLNPNSLTPDNDKAIDEALLDEALAQGTPAELEAKILSLTDPKMLSLLDEALAPEPASDVLTQRILAATSATSGSGQPAAGDVGVLARIGPATLRYAAAAAIALAVGLGVWFANQDPVDTNNSFAISNNGDLVKDTATDTEPAWLTDEQYASNTGFFDNATESLESNLSNLAENLDDASVTRDTLWAELDAYEQFLYDIES